MQLQDKVIRKAIFNDFMAIAALDRHSWGQDAVDAFIPDGEHAWRLWIEYAHVLVAECSGQIVGAILAFPTNVKTENLFVVHKVFVHDQFRGKRIGSDLFQQLLLILDQENAASFLTVKPDNEAAIQLYTKMGYQSERYVAGYYREHEHRVVMTRRINYGRHIL